MVPQIQQPLKKEKKNTFSPLMCRGYLYINEVEFGPTHGCLVGKYKPFGTIKCIKIKASFPGLSTSRGPKLILKADLT